MQNERERERGPLRTRKATRMIPMMSTFNGHHRQKKTKEKREGSDDEVKNLSLFLSLYIYLDSLVVIVFFFLF